MKYEHYFLNILTIVAIIFFASCKSVKYIPIENTKTEYIDSEVEKIIQDTVKETRFVMVKGDTVVDIREIEKIKRIEVHDTTTIEKTDTISVPYPVEKKLGFWESTKIKCEGAVTLIIFVLVVAFIIWLIKKMRNKT